MLTVLSACSTPSGSTDPPSPRTEGTSPTTQAPSDAATVDLPSDVDYVALGDSYTAGPLIPDLRLDPASCLRSTHNYPAYLAAYLSVRRYTDVSCSGATTRDAASRQQSSFGSNATSQRPQLDAVRGGTDLVSVGLGGNDFGLFSALTAASGGASPDVLLEHARAVRPRIAALVRAVHARAPRAVVVVVGYPKVLPSGTTCRSVPLPASGYAAADRVEQGLNASLRAAAKATGASYVDVYAASRGHDACAGSAAWINGANGDSSRAAAFHPFETGMKGAAAAIYTALTGRTPPSRPPFDSGAPTP